MGRIAACDCLKLLCDLQLLKENQYPIEVLVVKVNALHGHLEVASRRDAGDATLDAALTQICQELFVARTQVAIIKGLPVWRKHGSGHQKRALETIEQRTDASLKILETAYQVSSYFLSLELLADSRAQNWEASRVLPASSPLAPRGARDRLAAFVVVTSSQGRTAAISYLIATAALQEDSNDFGGAAETFFNAATLQGRGPVSDVEDSVTTYHQALRCYEKQRGPSRNLAYIAESHYRLGNTYAFLPIPQIDKAVFHLKTALPIFSHRAKDSAVAKIHVDLSDCLPATRKWEAVSHLIQARDYYQRSGNNFCEGEMWFELAVSIVFRAEVAFRLHAMSVGITKMNSCPDVAAGRAMILKYTTLHASLDPQEVPLRQDVDGENRPIYFDPESFGANQGAGDWRHTPYEFCPEPLVDGGRVKRWSSRQEVLGAGRVNMKRWTLTRGVTA
ncbi:hypothetical protein RQP46_001059 [Phenoliferia psychrophenolica]